MEIDKATLLKLLEVFVEAGEVFQRESTLYQMLFEAACKTEGLDETETQKIVERGREVITPKIITTRQEQYQALLDKLPEIVDLLDSNRDEAFRLLKEWSPNGPPN